MLRKQKGIGLLELMLSLAIIAVLLIMATRYFQSTSQSQKVNQAINDINAIQAASAHFFAGDPSGTLSQAAISPWMPSDWADGAGRTPWGGNYTVAESQTTPGNVVIGLSAIPEKACDALEPLISGMTTSASTGCQNPGYSGEFGPSDS